MTEEMRQMIDRFYLGELTIDEERRLIGLLLSDNCPLDLKVERHALIMLARQEAIDMPGDLEERVLGVIKSYTTNINRYRWLVAAAVFLLIAGVGYWSFLHKETEQSPFITASVEKQSLDAYEEQPEKQVDTAPATSDMFLKKTKPQHKLVAISEPEEVITVSTIDPDTINTPATTEQKKPQAVEKKTKPSESPRHVIYPSDLRERKHLDNRLTAKVYMSSTMAGSKAESLSQQGVPSNMRKENADYHRQPVRLGLSLRYRLNDHWSIESGLLYTHLSSDITITEDGITSVKEQRLNYIGIPLNVSYDLWRSRYYGLYVTAGGTIEKSIDTSPWQLSLNGAVGAEYKLTNYFSLFVEPGLGYYFKDGSSIPTIYKDRPLNFSLSLGLRFNLK